MVRSERGMASRNGSSVTWPVYARTEIVCCRDCRKPIARANEGGLTFFHRASGNRVLKCQCGQTSHYDIEGKQR